MAGDDHCQFAAARAAMPDDACADRLSFLGRRLPPEWELRVLALAPGEQRPYDEDEWRDALVVVESGQLELECSAGGRRRFPAGSILWMSGLPLRALHNDGAEPTLVAAVSRRR
jgi:hypothetical protein